MSRSRRLGRMTSYFSSYRYWHYLKQLLNGRSRPPKCANLAREGDSSQPQPLADPLEHLFRGR